MKSYLLCYNSASFRILYTAWDLSLFAEHAEDNYL